MDRDEQFSYFCYKEARRRARPSRPYRDDETITFRDFFGFPKVSDDPEQQVRYWEMRLNGESHRFAEVIATRSFPSINGTDKAWNRGRSNGNQFANCPGLGDHFRRIADRAGVSTTGKYYVHGLGRFPGDPRAWCADTSDALRVARERNLNLDGIVSHRAHGVDPVPDIPLAEDIWERDTRAYLAENPGVRYEDAREKVFDVRTGRVALAEPLVSDDVPHPADVLEAEGL